MMGNVKKDLDSAFANKQDVAVSGGPDKAPVEGPAAASAVVTTPAATAPAGPKQPSKFASALDKVVSDDRPADLPDEEKPVTATVGAAPAATATTPEEAAAAKKAKKKKTDTDPLTDDEKASLADVMAEEQKTATASDSATVQETAKPAAETAAATPAMTTETASPVVETANTETPATTTDAEPLTKKEKKKKKHTTGDEPQFLDFNPGAATTTAATTASDVATVAPEADTKASRKKKKQRDAEEMTATPVTVDSTVTTAPEETIKPSRKKKQKRAEDTGTIDSSALKGDEWVTVNKTNATAATTPATTEAVAETKPAIKDVTRPVLNSDCQQMLNGEGFKKLVKRMSAQGNESGMVETFNKNVRNTCLSVDQIRALAQMIDTDDYRYKMLEIAYQHTYETGNFPALQELLKDDYYKKRFKAMMR